ncbi:MAG: AprI/Inh family metalloprotease inhibitor [Rhizobiaceae bacterium]|nr:AprI/Inh family metalloprotease inhibitor [Rhizobiaceae bacterium]
MKFAAPLVLSLVLSSAALAQDDLVPIDLSQVDPAMVDDMFGAWEIADESGKRTCRVELQREETIGGMAIDVDPACAKVFPVMDEIAAWRLMEGWTIVLADATRKTRVVFFTPDERYIARDEVDGIFTIGKVVQ